MVDLYHIGNIISGPAALQQCKVKKIGHFEHFPKEKKVLFSVSMEAPDSSLVSVPVSSHLINSQPYNMQLSNRFLRQILCAYKYSYYFV